MTRLACWILPGVALLAVAGGCSRGKESADDGGAVFATVNGTRLTESGLRDLVPSDFYDKLTMQHKKEIVNEWVNSELLYKEAMRMKLDNDPGIQKILENAKRTLLINELLERTFSTIEPPKDDELRKFYGTHQQYFTTQDRQFRVRYARLDSKNDADDFRRRVKSRGGFSELAKERSKDSSAKSGGDLGVIDAESVPPDLWQAIEETYRRYGLVKVSDVFQVESGWGCLIVDEVFEPGRSASFEGARNKVLDMYMAESRDKAKAELLEKLSSGAKITYDYEKGGK